MTGSPRHPRNEFAAGLRRAAFAAAVPGVCAALWVAFGPAGQLGAGEAAVVRLEDFSDLTRPEAAPPATLSIPPTAVPAGTAEPAGQSVVRTADLPSGPPMPPEQPGRAVIQTGETDAADPPPETPRSGFVRLLGPFGDFSPSRLINPPPAPSAEGASPDGEPIVPPTAATVRAKFAQNWTDGADEISLLRGPCQIVYGDAVLSSNEMVVWRRTIDGRERLTVYLEGNATLKRTGQDEPMPSLMYELLADTVEFQISGQSLDGEKADKEPLYLRAAARRRTETGSGVRAVRRPIELPAEADDPLGQTVRMRPTTGGGQLRRIRMFPRSGVPFNVETKLSDRSIPPEQQIIISGGVNVLIDMFDEASVVDLSADRIVIWTEAAGTQEFQAEMVQTETTAFTIYLEGNIIIRRKGRSGPEVVEAARAVYDARDDRALIEDAELRAYQPSLGTDLRVRAETLRQFSEGRYHAQNAWTTTSSFGRPGYRIQSSDIYVEPRYDVNLGWLGVGDRVIDPVTGMETVETPWLRSYNNTFYIKEAPVFYSPYVSGPADMPNIPLKRFVIGNDRRFGFLTRTAWDVFGLFGAETPPGVQLNLLADYYSKRGFGVGLQTSYGGTDLFGGDLFGPDRYRGNGTAYFINDHGSDRLGAFRLSQPFEDSNRYKVTLRHRQEFLDYDTRVNAELGIVSDYNFVEQYFNREFLTDKDEETLLYGTGTFAPWGRGNWAWEALGQPVVNNFETQTGWLPKLDLWGLHEPLLDGPLTYSTHNQLGYGNINPGSPFAPALAAIVPGQPLFQPFSYMPDVQGLVGMTRHELDLQLPVGPFNIVPFAMGEGLYQEQGIDGTSLGRISGSVGTRASIQFQRLFPDVYNRTFGLDGLAHKIRLEGEYRLTETSDPLGDVAQYNELEDNAQQRLRHREANAYFGGLFPAQVDPRVYGVRSGLGTTFASPYYETLNDQEVIRLAARQRLQTRTGPPGATRIRDWMTLDTGVSLFPNAARDNFGETAGLAFADYSWAVGQRTTLLASTQYDFFDFAPQIWNVGVISQRSRRGSVYLGVRHIEIAESTPLQAGGLGGLNSDYLIASYSYNMSPKWVSTASGSIDLNNTQNRGGSLTLTRLGADFNVHLGLTGNSNTKNVGFMLFVEPRFGNFRNGSPFQLSSLNNQNNGFLKH